MRDCSIRGNGQYQVMYKLRITAASLDAGNTVAGLLAEPPAPDALAITLFEARPPAFVVEAYYDAAPSPEVIERLLTGQVSDVGRPSLEVVPDANWVVLSQAALPPIRAGRFVVHGSHDRARFVMRRLAIEIDAGEAFGSGHNATTALCLEALDALVRSRRFTRVLDLGCGSGVLGIASARMLPAARVLASDNDPVATRVAQANARLNGVARRMKVVAATGFDHALLSTPGSFDLVLANILPGPLIALAPAMRRALRRRGVTVLSGLLDHQVREVDGAYRAQGFRVLHRRQRDGWSALALLNTRS